MGNDIQSPTNADRLGLLWLVVRALTLWPPGEPLITFTTYVLFGLKWMDWKSRTVTNAAEEG